MFAQIRIADGFRLQSAEQLDTEISWTSIAIKKMGSGCPGNPGKPLLALRDGDLV